MGMCPFRFSDERVFPIDQQMLVLDEPCQDGKLTRDGSVGSEATVSVKEAKTGRAGLPTQRVQGSRMAELDVRIANMDVRT